MIHINSSKAKTKTIYNDPKIINLDIFIYSDIFQIYFIYFIYSVKLPAHHILI